MALFEKIFNTLEPSDMKNKKSHIKNLYSVAMADGILENGEFEFMLSVADKLYISRETVNHVVKFPEDIAFYVPTHDREKLDQIHDCVCMAMIGGQIDEREISICKLISVKMGFRPIVVDKLIHEIITSIIKGVASEFALRKLLKEL